MNIDKCFEQLERCGFSCIAGSLENSTAYNQLKSRIAELQQDNATQLEDRRHELVAEAAKHLFLDLQNENAAMKAVIEETKKLLWAVSFGYRNFEILGGDGEWVTTQIEANEKEAKEIWDALGGYPRNRKGGE